MTTLDHDNLRRLAEAAAPGWLVFRKGGPNRALSRPETQGAESGY